MSKPPARYQAADSRASRSPFHRVSCRRDAGESQITLAGVTRPRVVRLTSSRASGRGEGRTRFGGGAKPARGRGQAGPQPKEAARLAPVTTAERSGVAGGRPCLGSWFASSLCCWRRCCWGRCCWALRTACA
jgi:hypothetical protein